MTDKLKDAAPRRRYTRGRAPTLALGSITAASVVLSGCGDEPTGDYTFNSIDECVTTGFEQSVCEAEFQAALTQHAQTAPRFDDLAACEAQFGEGRCNVVQQAAGDGSTQSFFVPFLTGYLVSNALRNVTSYGAYRVYRRENPVYNSGPVYRTRSGGNVSPRRDATTGKTELRPLNQNTRTVARRGFGGRSTGRGWGG